MQINIQKFEKKLKLKINNKKLFIEAFTHKSANNKKIGLLWFKSA